MKTLVLFLRLSAFLFLYSTVFAGPTYTGETILRNTGGRELLIDNDNGDSTVTFHDAGDMWFSMGIDYSDGRRFKLNGGGALDSSNHFTMDSQGRIGLGVLPSTTLLGLGGWNIGSSGSNSNGSTQILVSGQHNQGVNAGSSSGTYKLKIEGYNNDGTVVYPLYIMDENQYVDFWIKNRPTQSGTPSMFFAGNFGIGTTSPNYKLEVNGIMRAKEIKVETNWSDYVFEEDYYLMPLDKVEAHIEEHGHLPDVPSAKTIQEEGLSVGESQAMLMRKVEELTLYMLEMRKEKEALLLRLEELEAKLVSE